jgi:hypothetical protein
MTQTVIYYISIISLIVITAGYYETGAVYFLIIPMGAAYTRLSLLGAVFNKL